MMNVVQLIQQGEGDHALLMLHGRGGSAHDILTLHKHFSAACFAFTAHNHVWYPYSFMQPREKNESFLSASLSLVHAAVNQIRATYKSIFVLGFSQGACLALEYGARYEVNGIIAFSGGFLGLDAQLPLHVATKRAFVSCSFDDPYIPLERAKRSAHMYASSGAHVATHFYEGNTHTITDQEIEGALCLLND